MVFEPLLAGRAGLPLAWRVLESRQPWAPITLTSTITMEARGRMTEVRLLLLVCAMIQGLPPIAGGSTVLYCILLTATKEAKIVQILILLQYSIINR